MLIIYVWQIGNFWDSKRSVMYSPEFMRYLINYQKPEYNENVHKQVKNFKFGLKDRVLASVLLLSKK